MSRRSPTQKLLTFTGIGSLLGIVLSAWLTQLHVRVHTDPSYSSQCAISEAVNCETVAISSYSVMLGLPISVWGLLGFTTALFLTIRAMRSPVSSASIGLLALHCTIMAVVAIALGTLSVFAIGAVCFYCVAVYGVAAVLAGITGVLAQRNGGYFNRMKRAISDFVHTPREQLKLVLVPLILFVAVWVGTPRYWGVGSWYSGTAVERGFDETGNPWLGARHPEFTIHEYLDYECPHCRLFHRKLRRLLADHWSKVRLVRHDTARMPCVPNHPNARFARCSMVRAAHCAGQQGRYWEWNDAAMLSPKPLSRAGRKSYELDLARSLNLNLDRFQHCWSADESARFAQQVYKEAQQRRIRSTPIYWVDGKKLTPKALVQRILEQPWKD